MKDLLNFSRNLEKFATECIDDFKLTSIHDFAEELKKLLKSGRAGMSAKRLNQLFKERNHTDGNGQLITVANPSEIADKITVVDGIIMIALTQDEDRWFRADVLFGNDILAELGIKYRQE